MCTNNSDVDANVDADVDDENEVQFDDIQARAQAHQARSRVQEGETGSNAPISFGISDEDFAALLETELRQHPLADAYPDLFDAAPKCMVKWRQRYRGDASVWKRLFDKDRVLKEFIEAAPVIDAVRRFVQDSTDLSTRDTNNQEEEEEEGQQPQRQRQPARNFTIIDLCSGKGFLSMFLSELLPPSKVSRIILMDKAWPMHGTTTLGSHHMNWQHIYGTVPSSSQSQSQSPSSSQSEKEETYFETWHIPLTTSKQDLKHGSQRRRLAERFLQDPSSPVILVGIHLCGTLSLHAVRLFNDHANVKFFCLKPCCLPGMVHAKRREVFRVGRHAFDARVVGVHGKWNKDKWTGPRRSKLATTFAAWVQNLFLGIGGSVDNDSASNDNNDIPSSNGNELGDQKEDGDHNRHDHHDHHHTDIIDELQKKKVYVRVQIDGGYQNEFLFAERLPVTESVWKTLEATTES